MKLLFDQNLSPSLVNRLADLFPGSRHVQDEGLDCANDEQVWQHARQHELVIVTKDADYNNLHLAGAGQLHDPRYRSGISSPP